MSTGRFVIPSMRCAPEGVTVLAVMCVSADDSEAVFEGVLESTAEMVDVEAVDFSIILAGLG